MTLLGHNRPSESFENPGRYSGQRRRVNAQGNEAKIGEVFLGCGRPADGAEDFQIKQSGYWLLIPRQ